MSFNVGVKKVIDTGSSVAVIVAAAVLVWTIVFKQPNSAGNRPQVERIKRQRIDAALARHQVGKAAVAIIEFSDFQCPFCSKHATNTLPAIKKRLVDSGKVRYISFHYPIETIHPQAFEAAAAAECAGQQGRFWDMHERLFANSKALSHADLVANAQALGLDEVSFEICLRADAVHKRIRADHAEGGRLGVTGTPVFFLGIVKGDGSIDLVKRIRGAASFDVFAKEVEETVSDIGPS